MIMKGLKVLEGVVNVVSIMKEVGKILGMLDKVELFFWSVVMKGFKFIKSVIWVLELVGSLFLGVISVLG